MLGQPRTEKSGKIDSFVLVFALIDCWHKHSCFFFFLMKSTYIDKHGKTFDKQMAKQSHIMVHLVGAFYHITWFFKILLLFIPNMQIVQGFLASFGYFQVIDLYLRIAGW